MKKTLDKTGNVVVASDRLYRSVKKVIQEAQGVVSRVANWAMVESNWRIGFLIVEDEQKGKRKAEYGKAVLKDLARRLTAEYGSGYDESNLRYMRLFYLAFPIRDALRHELSWTHYRSLTRVSDPIAREWYMNECIASPKKPFVVKLRRKRNSIASKSRIWLRSRSKYRLFTQRPEPPERKR